MKRGFDKKGFKQVINLVDHVRFNKLCTNSIVTDEWPQSMIKCEIILLINEYWFDESDKVGKGRCKQFDILNN